MEKTRERGVGVFCRDIISNDSPKNQRPCMIFASISSVFGEVVLHLPPSTCYSFPAPHLSQHNPTGFSIHPRPSGLSNPSIPSNHTMSTNNFACLAEPGYEEHHYTYCGHCTGVTFRDINERLRHYCKHCGHDDKETSCSKHCLDITFTAKYKCWSCGHAEYLSELGDCCDYCDFMMDTSWLLVYECIVHRMDNWQNRLKIVDEPKVAAEMKKGASRWKII